MLVRPRHARTGSDRLSEREIAEVVEELSLSSEEDRRKFRELAPTGEEPGADEPQYVIRFSHQSQPPPDAKRCV